MMLRQEFACPRNSMLLGLESEEVEVLQELAPLASSRYLMASVPEDPEEAQ